MDQLVATVSQRAGNYQSTIRDVEQSVKSKIESMLGR